MNHEHVREICLHMQSYVHERKMWKKEKSIPGFLLQKDVVMQLLIFVNILVIHDII